MTLAAAAAAAARRTGSPSAEAGSKSAWGEGKNDTLGRSEGKTSPESTYSAESSSRTLVPTSAPEPAVLSAGTAKIMEKYARMRKMGIPDGAIRHKMKQDGVDAANIAGFFIAASNPVVRRATPAVARDSATASSQLNALQSREDLKKYFKMKKLGLPDGAIRQKMQKDGMSGVDIAAFFGERPPAAAAAAAARGLVAALATHRSAPAAA